MPPSDQEPAYRLVDPSTGDIVGSFYENGSGDVEIQPSDGTQYKFPQSPSDNVDVARLQDVPDNSIEVFEADGTFDATGIDDAYVEVVGGGGGSAGVSGTTGDVVAGGGGGGGGYAADYVDVSSTSSVSVTVGTGGSGGASGDNAGSGGSNSSFGTSVEASGGNGGAVSVSGPVGGGGGVSGTVQISGGQGGQPYDHNNAPAIGPNPIGGGSQFSNPTQIRLSFQGGSLSSAEPGPDYGGGASGPVVQDVDLDEAGADGGDGIVIVRY